MKYYLDTVFKKHISGVDVKTMSEDEFSRIFSSTNCFPHKSIHGSDARFYFILFILYQPQNINDNIVICPRKKSMRLYLMNITGYCPQQQQKLAHCLTISSKICVRSIKIYLIPTRYYLVLRCELMHRNVSFHHLIR